MEGSRPVAKQEKEDEDAIKIAYNLKNIFLNNVKEVITMR